MVKSGGAWKNDRTTGRKYSGSDSKPEPGPGTREKLWVSGYTRADGTKVDGYYKKNPAGAATRSSKLPGVSKSGR